MSHVVLVHGAWAGSWVWDTVLAPLRAAGCTPHALSLPGVGEWGADDVTLDDVAGVVADYVIELDEDVVLVGHSGGGIVVTQVVEMLTDRVTGVAYVAGMMLRPVSISECCAAGWDFFRLWVSPRGSSPHRTDAAPLSRRKRVRRCSSMKRVPPIRSVPRAGSFRNSRPRGSWRRRGRPNASGAFRACTSKRHWIVRFRS